MKGGNLKADSKKADRRLLFDCVPWVALRCHFNAIVDVLGKTVLRQLRGLDPPNRDSHLLVCHWWIIAWKDITVACFPMIKLEVVKLTQCLEILRDVLVGTMLTVARHLESVETMRTIGGTGTLFEDSLTSFESGQRRSAGEKLRFTWYQTKNLVMWGTKSDTGRQ